MDAYIGTSGWYVLKNFEEYSKLFNSVEINNTFYKVPTVNIIKKWYDMAPKNFKFSIKVNATITHYKKLKNVTSQLKKFISIIVLLKEKLGCVLFQFPKNFKYNEINFGRLKELKKIIPQNLKCAFEFRDNGWFVDPVYKLMKNKWVLTYSYYPDTGFVPSFDKYTPTGKFVYFRMHGSKSLYEGRHQSKVLNKIVTYKSKCKYVYFNNTDSVTNNIVDAVHDAARLSKKLKF